MYENTYSTKVKCDIETLYNILLDLDNYPEIVPHIKKIIYKDRNAKPLKAHIVLEYLFVKMEYDCDIFFHHEDFSIEVIGYGYSFEHINGYWFLEKISDNETKISYKINFKLKSKVQQKIAEKIFDFYGDKLRDKIKSYVERFLNRRLR
jgi:ribosome-associated toxin RatA of RatAB toxin-antitoxin module